MSPASRAAIGKLPAESTSFVGRRRLLAEVKSAFANTRLLTLVGPGGVGKTRLAVRAAADLRRTVRDGAWFVDLAGLEDPHLVAKAVITSLGVADKSGQWPTSLLVAHLASREALLVLDNCEHLLDAIAVLADVVLKEAAGVRLLATSRQPLGISGERVLQVPGCQALAGQRRPGRHDPDDPLIGSAGGVRNLRANQRYLQFEASSQRSCRGGLAMRRGLAVIAGLVSSVLLLAVPAQAGGTLTFTVFPLLQPDGSSENAISISGSGQMAMTSLSWQQFGTNTWVGAFGSMPAFVGQFDASLAPGIGGGGDADVDLGSTGTLHLTSLVFFFNPVSKIKQLGVSSVACPNADVSSNFANCKSQIIDTTQADRQWITSRGADVWIAYHDSGSSTTVHVQRSSDDGLTWRRVGDPIVGQGGTTGASTFNSDNGPIVADPSSNFLYDVFAAGTASVQKGTSANFNQVFVSRSSNGGLTWQASLVFSAPSGTILNNVFPSLAVDPANGTVYATWSDRKTVWVSRSTDHGVTWGPGVAVSSAPANTAVFPWVAARNGLVDVVYYGTTASSKDSPTAVWNVYLSQSVDFGATFTQSMVSPHPNHVGPICTNGIACAPGTRNLLDLFEVDLTVTGKAGVIYTDDTLTNAPDGSPLPQAVLAMQT